MKRLRANRSGLTLLEVVISLAIFTMLILVSAATIPVAARSSGMCGLHAQALSLAQHKIDQCRAVGYGRLTYAELKSAGVIDASPTISPFSFVTIDDMTYSTGNSDGFFRQPTGTITVADESTGLQRVTVTITWQGDGSKQTAGSITLVGLIAQE
jgi:prepilin-type N-terminal cleavage/methylation domain-containing protein